MTFDDFKDFIDEQDTFLRQGVHANFSEKELALTRTVKFGEEFGELCDEVLGSFGDQRTGKMGVRSTEDLGDEFADVMIVTFLLAKTMGVDMMEALERKIDKIKTKHNKELE